MSDITSQSLTSLVKNIKEKKLSSEEVTTAFVNRSEKSKELNSYITEDFSNAIDKAKKFDEKPNLDLKLPGIPMAVKDLFCTKDIRTTAGSKILENFVPTYESTVTQNIWNEGAILLGKLNCDEFAMGSGNENTIYGPVKNPLNVFKVADCGATPCPHITIGSLLLGAKIKGTSPPGPFKCGSTTWRVKPVATAASNAFPPFSKIDIPTAEAIQ